MNRFPAFPGSIVLATTLSLSLGSRASAQDATEHDRGAAEAEALFGFLPSVFEVLPDAGQGGAWEEFRVLTADSAGSVLPVRIRALTAMAVAGQIPSPDWVEFHAAAARRAGASEGEIAEAAAMAAITRHWSTVLNGLRPDPVAFRTELDAILAHAADASGSRAAPLLVRDARSAYVDMEHLLGRVPPFFRAFPEAAIAGAWREFRNVQLSSATALTSKHKELIGLAVAAQIPCAYCVDFHTAFAKANGASDDEIREAIAVAAETRHWGSLSQSVNPEDLREDLRHMARKLDERAHAGE